MRIVGSVLIVIAVSHSAICSAQESPLELNPVVGRQPPFGEWGKIKGPANRPAEQEQPCIICDAVGRPIPFASVTADLTYPRRTAFPQPRSGNLNMRQQQETRTINTVTSRRGSVMLPKIENCQITLTVSRRGYADARIETRYPPFRGSSYALPVVHEDSVEYSRCLKGRVVDSAGVPLAGAIVQCRSIRTPGMGLINPLHPMGQVVTNATGEFSLYMPAQQNNERGKLIPPGSRFEVSVSSPADRQIYPAGGYYSNAEPVVIALDTTSPVRRFVIETEQGNAPINREVLSHYTIRRLAVMEDGMRVYFPVDIVQALLGVRVPPGEYHATRHTNLGTLNFPPITVTAHSDKVLRFNLPKEVTFRGRIVDGVTGQPLPGAFIAGFNSSGSGSLATLTDEQWTKLYELQNADDLDGEHLQILKPFFGARALVRADRNGEFSLTEPLDRPYYGLIFFAEGRIPYMVRKAQFEDQKTKEWKSVEVPLFKAATVTVNPTYAGDRLGVTPEWIIDEAGQPEWFDRFQEAGKYSNGDFAFDSWMKLNEDQPLYVPAGLKLRLRLRAPYNDEVANVVCREQIQLAAGQNLHIGEVKMPPTVPLSVRVVGPDGAPIEGVPVRRLHDDENAWCVAHNTDASGLATFGTNPNSTGRIRAGEYREAPTAPFKLQTDKLDEPINIQLTQQQIDRIFREGSRLPR